MGRKKSPRYTEVESPNLRPRQEPRTDDDNADMASQNANQSPHTDAVHEQAAGVGYAPPSQPVHAAGPAQTPAPPPSPTDHILSELVRMMGVQQAAIQASNEQMQAFMAQQAQFQRAMYEQQLRANDQKQKANPPRFYGRQDEDLELWLFHIEEHFAVYADLRDCDDSRFVDMVVPFLGTDVMSWYREFKTALGDTPRTWSLFKQQIRARFRDSDFEFKLLTKMYELQPTGTQQEYTTKFMQLMSQSSVEMHEVVKRWFYQQNLRADTSAYVSQSIPETLQDTIEYAQRFEDSQKQARPKQQPVPDPTSLTRSEGRNQNGRGRAHAGASGSRVTTATTPATRAPTGNLPTFVPTCHKCGVLGHKSPDCPTRGAGATQKN